MADDPQRLRQRALALRRLARRIESSPTASIRWRADDHTWIGPTATRIRGEIDAARRTLDTAAAELRSAAMHLEQQATQAELAQRRAAAALSAVSPGSARWS